MGYFLKQQIKEEKKKFFSKQVRNKKSKKLIKNLLNYQQLSAQRMSVQEQEIMQRIFEPNNKLVLKQWMKVNSNTQSKTISIEQMVEFIKNVFQASKDQLEMDIDQDTDYSQMVQEYIEETQQNHQQFTYQSAVNLLNWAVEAEDNQQQENNHIHQTHNKEQNEIQHNHQTQLKKQPQQNIQQLNKKSQQYKSKAIDQQNNEITQLIGYKKQSLIEKYPHKKPQNIHQPTQQHNQNYLNWDQTYHQDIHKIKLYQSINSYQTNQKNTQNHTNTQQNINQTLKKPISIQKSLAKINLQKQQLNQPKLQHLNDPNAPQLKYIKKKKIIIKNKKPKPKFQPQTMGLKQLFKFYCSLHSQHSHKKKPDPTKGMFDQMQTKKSQLYMHNFMLLCKDFSIIESKKTLKGVKLQTATEPENKEQKQQKRNQNKRLSKGSVPQAKIQPKQKSHKISKKKKHSVEKYTDIWDRDKLCVYFKKEADYSLNVKYDMFVEILKYILKNKITIEEETSAEQNFDEGGAQNNQNQSNVKTDPIIFRICQFFNIDTQQNFKQTMNKLKIQYKIIEPQLLRSKSQEKKLIGQLHTNFQQGIQQKLKIRQLQKEKQRIEVKQKYLHQFSTLEGDVYSSFKNAKKSKNMYGSAPQLLPLNLSSAIQASKNQSFLKNKDSDIQNLRNNISQNFNSGCQISSILKEARMQVMQEKQNPLNLNKKLPKLVKSRFKLQTQKQKIGYEILHKLRQPKQEQLSLSSILLNKSQLTDDQKTQKSPKIKNKSKDIHSPLLQRMGCHQEDELLDKYFDQQKNMQKSAHNTNYR